ncbi:hypothetical protein HDU90_007712 [Geranomyces variabilis]|nr:hypothetical protein HDU90_007712 [Geranomyces variabilis]
MNRMKKVADLEAEICRLEGQIAVAAGTSLENLQTLLEEVFKNAPFADERAAFERATEEQAMLASIKEFAGSNTAVVSLLQGGPDWEGWDDRVYARGHGSNIEINDAKFWKALRLALVTSMLSLHLPATISSTMSGRITIPIQWRWCETKYRARDDDEGTQLADGIALSVNRHNLILMESSGGVKDAKAHSEGDTYKLIENSVYALREILAAHKDVSWERMKTMQVLSVQLIKNRATLMTTRVTEGPAGMSWELVELRSAQLPAYWSQVTKGMLIVEMAAAAYQAVTAVLDTFEKAQEELCGMAERSKPTVREKLGTTRPGAHAASFDWSRNDAEVFGALVYDIGIAVSPHIEAPDDDSTRRQAHGMWSVLKDGAAHNYLLERSCDGRNLAWLFPDYFWTDTSQFFREDEHCQGIHSDIGRSPSGRKAGRGLVPPFEPAFIFDDDEARQGVVLDGEAVRRFSPAIELGVSATAAAAAVRKRGSSRQTACDAEVGDGDFGGRGGIVRIDGQQQTLYLDGAHGPHNDSSAARAASSVPNSGLSHVGGRCSRLMLTPLSLENKFNIGSIIRWLRSRLHHGVMAILKKRSEEGVAIAIL